MLQAIDLALELGISPLKVNCVLMAGTNDDELLEFAELSRDRPIDVRFIEYMPFDGNRWDEAHMVPFHKMLDRVKLAHPGTTKLPTPPNDVAVSWRLPNAAGSVSFIASMTQPFCAGCNRLRLTADGALKVSPHSFHTHTTAHTHTTVPALAAAFSCPLLTVWLACTLVTGVPLWQHGGVAAGCDAGGP